MPAGCMRWKRQEGRRGRRYWSRLRFETRLFGPHSGPGRLGVAWVSRRVLRGSLGPLRASWLPCVEADEHAYCHRYRDGDQRGPQRTQQLFPTPISFRHTVSSLGKLHRLAMNAPRDLGDVLDVLGGLWHGCRIARRLKNFPEIRGQCFARATTEIPPCPRVRLAGQGGVKGPGSLGRSWGVRRPPRPSWEPLCLRWLTQLGIPYGGEGAKWLIRIGRWTVAYLA